MREGGGMTTDGARARGCSECRAVGRVEQYRGRVVGSAEQYKGRAVAIADRYRE